MKRKAKLLELEPKDTVTQQLLDYLLHCSEIEKQSIILLGKQTIDQAIYSFSNEKKPNVVELELHLKKLLQNCRKDSLEEVFSWKLFDIGHEIALYMGEVYKYLKSKLKNKSKDFLGSKQKKCRRRKQKERPGRNSQDESSNQTNETDIIY